ncbi:MAG: hypothetical protein QOD26_430 [Betaproteobacteria bacterium]|nr:hypothetical protein [Betaproteobacteria bacterium]
MSLLWRRKTHRIGLGPDSIIVSGSKDAVRVQGEGAGDWRSTLAALPEVLKNFRNQDVAVVLADQFVRYALLPWNATLKSEAEWVALAQHRFGALHGAPAAEWQVKVTETAPRGARLACAVERELVAGLAEQFVAAGVRLESAQPFLVAAFNRIRKTVGNGSCWIVVEERGRLTLALIQRGEWLAIRARRSDERWRNLLPEILERETAFLGLAEPCTRVIVCAQGAFDIELHKDWRTHSLSYRELALATETH